MDAGSINTGQDVGFAAAVYATRKATDLKESTVMTLLGALPGGDAASSGTVNPVHLGQQVDIRV